MISAVIDFALRQRSLLLAIGLMLLVWGLFSFRRLSAEAYPDVADIHIKVVAEWPGHSPEEIEQQITMPIESAVSGVPHLDTLRSTSLFGLSVVDVGFDETADNLVARQQILARLADIDLPPNAHARLGPDYGPFDQIYFYTLTSSNSQYDVMELKALQEQFLVHQLKSVPNVADVITFGGTTREYEVQVDPGKLLSHGLNLSDLERALSSNNVSGTGTFLERGEQSYNVHASSHFANAADIGATVVKSQNRPPVRVRDVASITEAPKNRIGRVGKTIRRTDGRIVDEDDLVEGIVLLRKGTELGNTIAAVEKQIGELNLNSMPPGVRIVPHLNRGDLVQSARDPVFLNVMIAILLVVGTVCLFLRNLRGVFIVVLTIPFSLSLAWLFLELWDIPTSLLSLATLDFGMIVIGSVLMVDNILRHLSQSEDAGSPIAERIRIAAHQAWRPIFYVMAILIAVQVPILTLQRIEGKLFRPMGWTIVIALLGALVFSLVLAPILASLLFRREVRERHNPWLMSITLAYRRHLRWCLHHSWLSAGLVLGCFSGASYLVYSGAIGSEFLPRVDEGAIWATETLPPSIALTKSADQVRQARSIFASYPEVTEVISQTGRADGGINPSGFFNAEYLVNLKPRDQWRSQFRNKEQLIAAMRADLRERTFGAIWNFSQPIEANLEEAATGVKSSLAVKLFGDDLRVLEQKGDEIVRVLAKIPATQDVGLLRVGGQPNVDLVVDQSKADQFGINLRDIQDAIEASMEGKVVAQVLDRNRRFDVAVRYQEPHRQTVQNIPQVQLLAPSGEQVALSVLSNLKVEDGASAIHRENGSRYVAITYSVHSGDLGTVDQAVKAVSHQVDLPPGYRLEWTGDYQGEKRVQARLPFVFPSTILIIFLMGYWRFQSFRRASFVLLPVGLAAVGGICGLYWTGTPFSVSSGIGFLALFSMAAQTALMIEYTNQGRAADEYLANAATVGTPLRLRPMMWTTLLAALGVIPTAISHGTGSDLQRPFAIVLLGGLIATSILIPLTLPTLYLRFAERRRHGPRAAETISGLKYLHELQSKSIIPSSTRSDDGTARVPDHGRGSGR